jgi:hypothetical protein
MKRSSKIFNNLFIQKLFEYIPIGNKLGYNKQIKSSVG